LSGRLAAADVYPGLDHQENGAAAEEVSSATEEMSAQAEEVVASATSLAEMATRLDALVARFRIESTGGSGAGASLTPINSPSGETRTLTTTRAAKAA
jgi:hypothetical protein